MVREGYILQSNEYVRATDKLSVLHSVCGKNFEISYKNFARGDRCSHCNGTPKKTTAQFSKEVLELHGSSYRIVGEYINNKEKIEIEHVLPNGDTHTYLVQPVKILSGRTCPICSKRQKKTTDHFANEVREMTNGEYEVLGEYINNVTPIKIRHNSEICGNHEYAVPPKSFVIGNRCPKCNTLVKHSRAHLAIRKFFEDNAIRFEEEVKLPGCVYKRQLSFDFGVFTSEDDFILIEYDGSQHDPDKFSTSNSKWKASQKEQLKRDQVKDRFCHENGIRLFRIKHHEDHLSRVQMIVQDFVKGANA